jgi:hypothetical protein
METISTMGQNRTGIAYQGLCFFKHMFIKSLLGRLWAGALILQADVGITVHGFQT